METARVRAASRSSRLETAPEQGLPTATAPTQSLLSWGSQHGCPSTRPPDDDTSRPTCSPWLRGHRSFPLSPIASRDPLSVVHLWSQTFESRGKEAPGLWPFPSVLTKLTRRERTQQRSSHRRCPLQICGSGLLGPSCSGQFLLEINRVTST